MLSELLCGKPVKQGRKHCCCCQSPCSGLTTKDSFSLGRPVRRMPASRKLRLEARLVSAKAASAVQAEEGLHLGAYLLEAQPKTSPGLRLC